MFNVQLLLNGSYHKKLSLIFSSCKTQVLKLKTASLVQKDNLSKSSKTSDFRILGFLPTLTMAFIHLVLRNFAWAVKFIQGYRT